MASFDQECPVCGHRMRIPDRFRDRTLRCLACGVEFAADPDPAEEARLTVRRRLVRVAAVAVIAVAVAVSLWWLGRPQTGNVLGALPGEIVTVGGGGAEWVPAGATPREAETLARERASGSPGVRLDPGTRLRVLSGGNPARVRVLEGPWTGRVVWVDGRWLRIAVDDETGMPDTVRE